MIDGLLAQMNYICFLKSKRLISGTALKVFEYDLERTVNNRDCLCYLWNLYHWSVELGKQCPFSYLVDYAKKKMSKEERSRFESKSPSGVFIMRLNF